MAKLDVIKEEISYLKLWLGIAVVTDISLFSWLVASVGQANVILTGSALVGAAMITCFALFTHKRIAKRIKDLEDL